MVRGWFGQFNSKGHDAKGPAFGWVDLADVVELFFAWTASRRSGAELGCEDAEAARAGSAYCPNASHEGLFHIAPCAALAVGCVADPVPLLARCQAMTVMWMWMWMWQGDLFGGHQPAPSPVVPLRRLPGPPDRCAEERDY